jgi:hypothetical protein
MRFRISEDARPQIRALLAAAVISIILWFIPFAELLTYPFRVFVTFIHEGGHAIAALSTGNSVGSLSVAMNASGETYTTKGGLFSQMFVASAGYIASMVFGAFLLVLIRKSVKARIVLLGSAGLVFALTLVFGLLMPITTGGAFSGIPFTFLAGTLLSIGLIALAKFASRKVATFFVTFLAVQCVLNALLDLKTVFFLSSPFGPAVSTDAVNMATATGIPAIFWVILWMAIALLILGFAMRIFVVRHDSLIPADLHFPEPVYPSNLRAASPSGPSRSTATGSRSQ